VRAGVAAAVLALAVAGCGEDDSTDGQITKSVRSWTAVMADTNGKAACDRMTIAARAEMADFANAFTGVEPTGDCAVDATRFTRKLPANALRQMRDADVAEIRVDDDVAIVHMEDGGPNELRLRRDGEEWYIDQAFRKGWRLVGAPSFGLTGG
jgi:hypothetical protein